ncbi:PMT2 [Hepatospora eriocheir]|uniref:PMT2 n=1 Tax=Hepatospora eriocheir TaxID=1081669 RepID=A0A1X0Q6T8_9MICR|nr:PMT2 [Hepatospora eriocheir]
MLTALSGYIYGQSSDKFTFDKSNNFPHNFDYVGMRRMHAAIGSLISLFAFLTLRNFKFSRKRSFLGSLIIIFDNGFTTICRLIILDAHLLCFTSFILLAFSYYYKTKGSILSQLLLGVGLGCVVSVKWLGCLTMLYVGIFIIYELYMESITKSVKNVLKFLVQRSMFLIVIPLLIYLFSF